MCVSLSWVRRQQKRLHLSHSQIKQNQGDVSGHSKFCCAQKCALQIDESVDVAGIPQMMVFARYISGNDIKEEFLFCDKLQTTTRGEDFFRVVDTNLKMEWINCR